MKKKILISDVIDSFGLSKFSLSVFFMIGLIMFFDGFDYMIVAYTMPQITKEWALTSVQSGSLVSWGMLGLIIGGLIIGPVSDKIGRKWSIILGMCLYSLTNVPIYFAPNYEFFAVFRVLTGIGIGSVVSVSVTMTAEFAPTKYRGILTASTFAFYSLGYVLAGLMGIYVIPSLGWRTCYLLAALPVFYAIIMMFVLPESPYWLVSKGREAEAIKVLQRAERMSKGTVSEYMPGSLFVPPPPKTVGVKALLIKENRAMTIALGIMTFCGLVITYGVTVWLPSLLVAKGYGMTKGYTFAIVQNGLQAIGPLTTGYVADKIGRKNNIIFAYVATFVCLICVGFAQTTWQIILFTILVGITMFYGQSGLNPIQAESFPTEIRNTGISWTQGFGRIGGLLTPLIVGGLIQTGVGFGGIFLFFCIPAVINILIGMFVVKETLGTKMEEIGEVKLEQKVTLSGSLR